MAKRKELEIVTVHEIPGDVVAGVVVADIAQIEADARTHPDADASRRILFAAKRLREIAINNMSPETKEKLISACATQR